MQWNTFSRQPPPSPSLPHAAIIPPTWAMVKKSSFTPKAGLRIMWPSRYVVMIYLGEKSDDAVSYDSFQHIPPRGAAIAAILLALAMTAGCQHSESPKSKGSTAEPAARSEKAEPMRPTAEAAAQAADRPRGARPNGRRLPQGIELRRRGHRAILVRRGAGRFRTRPRTSRWRTSPRTKCIFAHTRPNWFATGRQLYAYRARHARADLQPTAAERLTMRNLQPDVMPLIEAMMHRLRAVCRSFSFCSRRSRSKR